MNLVVSLDGQAQEGNVADILKKNGKSILFFLLFGTLAFSVEKGLSATLKRVNVTGMRVFPK
jgi:hypothetical protein